MEKLLSIVVPSYNMEAYLDRSLGSLIVDDELLPTLDVIVVNDGSKDRTSEIAHKYADKYPQTFRVIDKANGHYGSCINAALKVATGKYFKILDADDWYDTKALEYLLKKISHLDVDAVWTKYNEHRPSGIDEDPDVDIPVEMPLDIAKIEMPLYYTGMHRLAFRTALMREIGYRQTEGICYTDSEYVYFPLCNAQTIIFFNISLYQYFFDRPEQSMAVTQIIKNRNHFVTVLQRIIDDNSILKNENARALKSKYLYTLARLALEGGVLYHTPTSQESNIYKGLLEKIDKLIPGRSNDLLNIKIKGIPFYRLWYNLGHISNVVLSPVRYYLKKRLKIK